MKYSPLVVTLAVPCLMICTGVAQDQASHFNKTDETFVVKAAQGGLAEVELGDLAVQRGTNQKVKAFGHQMVEDHTKAGNELKSLASTKGVTVPAGIDPKSQSTKQRLSSLSVGAFDRAYMEDMVRDHEEDIADFQTEANSGSDPDFKAFAQKTLPTLRHHLQMAQDALAAAK